MVGMTRHHIRPRDIRLTPVLREAYDMAKGESILAEPIIYQSEMDFPSVLDAYTNRSYIQHGVGMIFLAPLAAQNNPERLNKRWARMLTTVNPTLQVPVLVTEPDVARMVAVRLRNTGSVGIRHIFMQQMYKGSCSPLVPMTDDAVLGRIQKLQEPYV